MTSTQSVASGFAVSARAGEVTNDKPKVIYEGKSTFTVLCFGCWLSTPHYMNGDKSVCISCGHKSCVAIRSTETSGAGQ
jgi:hypothetical protein